jgi:hypothetical protein
MPVFRLDRVYVDAAWDVRWTRVHVSPLARQASDHFPLVASLRVRPRATALPPGTAGATLHAPAQESRAVSPVGPLPGAGTLP